MKSLQQQMFGLIACIITDVASEHPSIASGLELDRSRLERLTAQKGTHLFTILLPQAADWFHQSLARGRLLDERPPVMGRRSRRDQRPKFLGGLFDRLFTDDGTLRQESSPGHVFAVRQILLACKKWHMACPKEKVDETFNDFIRVDEELPRSYPDTWDSDVPKWLHRVGHPLWGDQPELPLLGVAATGSKRWTRFRNLCGIMSSSLGYLDVYGIEPKHGPGVVADRVQVKFEFDHWPRKLGALFPADWFSSPDLIDRTRTVREFSSKVAAVPKTQKGPRIIASEPTAHQWIQGGIQRWLENAIDSTFLRQAICLRDQEPSRQLAKQASLTGDLATVDLSAASDRLSTRLVEFVFQGNHSLLDALHACRTRTYRLPDGRSGVLRKFAPMGSACTFPVQSIVFATIAAFAVMEANGLDITPDTVHDAYSQVRVFGDDIVVPGYAYPMLASALAECGLKVNASKSFATGNFRESCGMDAFKGVDVTPAYARSSYETTDPATLSSVVECSNNFHLKGLWRSADYLLKLVPDSERKLLPVADVAVGACTVRTFCRGMSVVALRANRDLHCDEVLVLDIESMSEKRAGAGEASLLQWYTESPDPDSFVKWSHGEATRPQLRKKKRWVTVL